MQKYYNQGFPKTKSLNTATGVNAIVRKQDNMYGFYLIILYLFLEYGRPHDLIPVLRYLHIPAITVAMIAISLFLSGKLYFKDKQTVIYLLVLSEMVIHGPIAVNNYWAFQVFYQMTVTFIAYLGIVNLIDNSHKFYKLIKYWIIIFIYLAIIGIVNRGRGIGGFIGDENDFCMALNMIIPFTLFGIFSAKNKKTKLYLIFLTCLFLFVIILSQSRGGFLGLAAVSIYCWLKTNRKIVISLIFGILVIFSLAIAPSYYWDEMRTISTENTESNPYGTGAQRIYQWKLGWWMFLENPVLGVGQGNFPWRSGEAEEELGVQWIARSLSGRAAHSLYFTLLSELGLIGAILYFSIGYISMKDLKYVKKCLKKYRDVFSEDELKSVSYLVLSLEASLVGFLISSIFISTLYYPNFWIWCAFVVSLKKIIQNKFENLKLISQQY